MKRWAIVITLLFLSLSLMACSDDMSASDKVIDIKLMELESDRSKEIEITNKTNRTQKIRVKNLIVDEHDMKDDEYEVTVIPDELGPNEETWGIIGLNVEEYIRLVIEYEDYEGNKGEIEIDGYIN